MILGIDISHWQDKVDFELLKSEGIEFCICKATQGDYLVDDHFVQHVTGAAAAGMIVGAYHWADPISNDDAQVKLFLETITGGAPVQFAMIDEEQHWASWAEYRARKITRIIPAQRIEENARRMLNMVQPVLQTVLYSRYSFLVERAAGVLHWINQWAAMWAQYPYKQGRETITWAAFKKRLPKVESLKLPPGRHGLALLAIYR